MLGNYERVYRHVLPAVRAAAARRLLAKYNMTQQRAAALLHITQAGVSKAQRRPNRQRIMIAESHIDRLAYALAANDQIGAQRAVCSICQDNIRFRCALMVR